MCWAAWLHRAHALLSVCLSVCLSVSVSVSTVCGESMWMSAGRQVAEPGRCSRGCEKVTHHLNMTYTTHHGLFRTQPPPPPPQPAATTNPYRSARWPQARGRAPLCISTHTSFCIRMMIRRLTPECGTRWTQGMKGWAAAWRAQLPGVNSSRLYAQRRYAQRRHPPCPWDLP